MSKRIPSASKSIDDKHRGIVNLYISGQYTTEHIAKAHTITPRQVQRIAKKYGVLRTAAESNRIMAPLKSKRRIARPVRPPKAKPTHCPTCGRHYPT